SQVDSHKTVLDGKPQSYAAAARSDLVSRQPSLSSDTSVSSQRQSPLHSPLSVFGKLTEGLRNDGQDHVFCYRGWFALFKPDQAPWAPVGLEYPQHVIRRLLQL